MRRNDREVRERDEILRIMEQCDDCRLALHDGDYPYILPLNFGVRADERGIVLYFHCAKEGKKLDLIARDGRAGFEMDCGHRLVLDEEKGSCTMEYRSVVGHGRIRLLPEAETPAALRILLSHYGREDFPLHAALLSRTAALALTVEHVTGKALVKPRTP